MWTELVQVFQKYMGTGVIVIWFLAALVYLFLNEKQRPKRIFFVYMPVIVLVLYFNPLFAAIFFTAVGSEIYYRIWWLIPVIIVIAYSSVTICERLKGRAKGIFALLALILIAVSGKLVYSSPSYGKAENCYHVPDAVVDICDAIVVPGREVKAAFPIELLFYVRQYSPKVCMPYGRAEVDGVYNEFLDAMKEEEIELGEVTEYANQTQCHYLIFNEEKKLLGVPQKFNLEFFERIDGYVIYRNLNIPLEY